MNHAPFITSDQQAPPIAPLLVPVQAHYRAELAMDRFGLKLASRLTAGADNLEHDFSERLRVARQQALAKRKLPALTRETSLGSNGSSAILSGGGDEPGWLNRLASFLPLVVLVVGLIAIPSLQNDFRANEVAEIDAALLTDDLPPAAFTDPGFAEFIKARRAAGQ
jgi:Protein of unknown function (DUF3619)